MLRITVHNNSQSITFQLEGRLSGPWIAELDKCWHRTLQNETQPAIRVDLTGLTFLDNAGKEYLHKMHCRGAEFVAADCETKSIIDEITNNSSAANGRRTKSATNGKPRRGST
jgi:hypothetical protein